MYENIPDNYYLLMTPGPLSTSKGVRNALLRDWCTWDKDYNEGVVQIIRQSLVALCGNADNSRTAVLMQGSGSFAVEATLTTAIGPNDKVLIISNGAYGKRIKEMAEVIKLNYLDYSLSEIEKPSPKVIEELLKDNPDITHVAMVHCETTTGMLNPLEEVARVVKKYNKILIVDAMSSFGGIPIDVSGLDIDFLISSANKCIQGVPGFGFVICKTEVLKACKGNARSLCLDLYDQWMEMDKGGKWRYTSPTHVVRAFYQALIELEEEGGITARYKRYQESQALLVKGMAELGFQPLLKEEDQSVIITSFLYPDSSFDFNEFYQAVKARGFVLYPGKISQADTFRIGNIGEIYPQDIAKLLEVIKEICN